MLRTFVFVFICVHIVGSVPLEDAAAEDSIIDQNPLLLQSMEEDSAAGFSCISGEHKMNIVSMSVAGSNVINAISKKAMSVKLGFTAANMTLWTTGGKEVNLVIVHDHKKVSNSVIHFSIPILINSSFFIIH